MQIKQKIGGLEGLHRRLVEIRDYLNLVVSEKLPINHQISNNIQDILNLLPNLNIDELVKSLLVKTNDMHLAMYISSLIRSILALHDLLNNKIKYKNLDNILEREIDAPENNVNKKEKEPSSPTKTNPEKAPESDSQS